MPEQDASLATDVRGQLSGHYASKRKLALMLVFVAAIVVNHVV